MTLSTSIVTLSSLFMGATAIPVNRLVDNLEKFNSFVQRFNSPKPLYSVNQIMTDIDTFMKIFDVQANPDLIKELVAFDATHVSSRRTTRSCPRLAHATTLRPQAFIDTITRSSFTDGHGNITAWGNFEITSNTTKRTIQSPCSCRAEINGDSVISHPQ
ncbi:hypothetical protein HD806DRAFT_530128 [Xylariaceae sp. AK1471]|nr:hypothetical protein HD806DRAFT_530128 [Xylariaceae sp. AK1471]